MTNQPSSAATIQKAHFFTFGRNCLSREIGAVLLTRVGGVALASMAGLGLALAPTPAWADIFVVNSTNDSGDGVCNQAECTLREAIITANALDNGPAVVDTVTFASGVNGTITLDIATKGNIDITDELTIAGPGANQLAVSGGSVAPVNGYGGIFYATFATSLSTITGLTLSHGNTTNEGGAISAYADLILDGVSIEDSYATNSGGGFYVYSGDVTLTNSTVSGNTAYDGGGFTAYSGDVTLTNSTVSGNTAYDHGGGFFVYSGNASLASSTVSGNTAYDGGGFYVDSGDATVSNSTVIGNTAYDHGGGFFVVGDATVTNSTVSGNTAHDGGGFYVDGNATLSNSTVSGNDAGNYVGGFFVVGDATVINSTVSGNDAAADTGGFFVGGNCTLSNSTVSGNTAGTYGGGFVLFGNATLTNSTVSNNTAGGQSGGLYVYGDATLANSIVAGNTAPTNPDVYVSPAYTLSASYSLLGIYDGTYTDNGGNIIGSGSIPVDPLLGPLADNGGVTWTHALKVNSPAVDVGSNALAAGLDYDQRGPGYPRIVGGNVDMGAFERRSDSIFFDGFELP